MLDKNIFALAISRFCTGGMTITHVHCGHLHPMDDLILTLHLTCNAMCSLYEHSKKILLIFSIICAIARKFQPHPSKIIATIIAPVVWYTAPNYLFYLPIILPLNFEDWRLQEWCIAQCRGLLLV